jgi:hypothetical protein
VLLAKTSKALARMNELFKTRAVQKTYWAIVEQKPAIEKATLVHWLKKNEAKNMSFASKTESKDALKCELEYEYKDSSDKYHLLGSESAHRSPPPNSCTIVNHRLQNKRRFEIWRKTQQSLCFYIVTCTKTHICTSGIKRAGGNCSACSGGSGVEIL